MSTAAFDSINDSIIMGPFMVNASDLCGHLSTGDKIMVTEFSQHSVATTFPLEIGQKLMSLQHDAEYISHVMTSRGGVKKTISLTFRCEDGSTCSVTCKFV
jgi:hypothetical protein